MRNFSKILPIIIRLNPIGMIVLGLIVFSVYLIYSANYKTRNLMKSYYEQNLIKQNNLNLDNDLMIPELSHNRHNLFNDEILKQELKLFEMVNLLELLNVIVQAAQNGGTQFRNIKNKSKIKWKDKGINDPLTEADLTSHQTIVQQIFNSFPGLKIISEENGNKIDGVENIKVPRINKAILLDELKNLTNRQVALSELTVWVDPLDATQEYTEDLTQYVTTMVCVAYKGKPIIGVIHKPFQSKFNNVKSKFYLDDSTYWAWDNTAYSNNLKHMLDERKKNPDLDKLNVIVSRSHAGYVKKLSKFLFSNNSKIISAGGTGYKVLELIKGNADIYMHCELIKKWDICAPNAIINTLSHEISANFTSLKGEPIDYNYNEPKNKNGVLASIGFNNSYLISKMKEIL